MTLIREIQPWRRAQLTTVVLWLGLSAIPGVAQRASDQPALPDFEKRSKALAADDTPERQAALAQLRAKLPEARVEWDERVGSPKFISAPAGFLTGPDGKGRGVSLTVAAGFAGNDMEAPAKGFLREHPGLFGHGDQALSAARVKRAFTTPHNGMRTVVWEQQFEEIPVFDAVLTAHTTRRGELVSLSSQFVPDPALAARQGVPDLAAVKARPPVSAAQAVALAARNLGETVNAEGIRAVEPEPAGPEQRQKFRAQVLNGEAETRLTWFPLKRDTLRLCREILLTSRQRGEMFRMLVDVQSGEVLLRRRLTEYLSDATYRVYTSDSPSPFSPGPPTPNTNQPATVARTLVTTPALNTNASPAGWILDGENETRGNNVDAHLDRDNNDAPDLPRPQGSPFRVFDFPMDLTQSPTTYGNAAVVQLFYWNNWMHDKLYELGFTEAAGNFQVDNFGRGGLGNDPVQADAQDGGGVNNANMATPPDGTAARMQMYLFDGPAPDRDGDFDAEVVLHEYTHGLSNRRVGGGVGLSALQSRGMGEGWSDFYGLALLSEPGDDIHGNYGAGAYLSFLLGPGFLDNYYFGIRRYPYSTDLNRNPLTFKDIDPSQADPHAGVPRSPLFSGGSADEVHNQGEVWCVTLWDARANLIERYGFAAGNPLFLRLVTDGMNLSPPNPNFLQARDGILQADQVNYSGANFNELWAAFAKRGMGFSASSPASSTTAGLQEAYDVPDDLRLSPQGGFTGSGPVGGPFVPSSRAYTLTNAGSNAVIWTMASTSSWLTVTPAGGTLPIGGATVATLSVNPLAAGLPMGLHSASVRFTNTVSGVGQGRQVSLRVGLPDYFVESFDAGDNDLDFKTFTFTPDGSSNFYAVCWAAATNFPADPAGGTLLSLSDDSFATVMLPAGTNVSVYGRRTNVFYVGSNGYLTFDGGDEDYTPSVGDHFARPRIAGLFDDLDPGQRGTVSWRQWSNRVAVTYLDVPEYGTFNTNQLQIELFFDGTIRLTYLRLDARSGLAGLSGGGGVPLGFQELDLTGLPDCVPPLRLTVPAASTEGAGLLAGQGRVTLPGPLGTNLVLALSSSDTGEVTLPPTVTLPAGQTNALFDLTVQDDALLDGSQTVTISVAGGGYRTATALIRVHDNETATLQVLLPESAMEGGPTQPGNVRVSAPPAKSVVVSLSSSDLTEVTVPALVLIPAGQTNGVFDVTPVNDTAIDGPQLATITAHVENWTDGAGVFTVLDDETTTLSVTLPAQAYENLGVLTNAGIVSLPGTLPTNLVVSLGSSDPSELTVPATASIPAGQFSARFNLSLVDDALVDGMQTVTVTATTPGFTSGSGNLVVLDDESPPVPTNPTPAPQATNVSAQADLAWQNGGSGITNDLYFGTNPAPGPMEFVGTTTTNTWDLPRLAPATTYYWQVVARRVGTTPGPVWQFTTRGVDHFEWQPVASPQRVGAPFGVTITAKDEFGATVSNFTGTVSLRARSTSAADIVRVLTFIRFADTNTSPSDLGEYWRTLGALSNHFTAFVESPTMTTNAAALANELADKHVFLIVEQEAAPNLGPLGTQWAQVLTDFVNNGGTVIACSHVASEHLLLANSGLLALTELGSLNSDEVVPVADHPLTDGVTDPFEAEYLHYYSNGNGVVALNTSAGEAVVVSRDLGFGHVVMLGTDFFTTNTPMDQILANAVRWPQLGGVGTVDLSPTNSGSFVHGAWTGAISVLTPQTNAALVATDSEGHRGQSNPFDVLVENDVAVAVVDLPDPVAIQARWTNLITVGNSGPLPAAGVTVTNRLHSSLTFVSASASQGACSHSAGVVECSLGALGSGASATITVVMTPGMVGAVTNVITVSRTDPDGYAGNNTALARSTVLVPALSVSDASVTEGNSGTVQALFSVSLVPAGAQPVTVSFATSNGTAQAGSDYVATNGVLLFAPGETNRLIPVTVLGDTANENNETFVLALSVPINAVLQRPTGTGTIVSDEGQAVALPLLLTDGDSFLWDVQPNGTIGDGSADAYDGGLYLTGFPDFSSGLLLGGRELFIGPAVAAGLEITRRIFVPADRGYARYLEIFRNSSGAPITTNVSIFSNLGSDGSTVPIATSSGDTTFATNDHWIVTDDFNAGGDPTMLHVLANEGATVRPFLASLSSDNLQYQFRLTIPPGEIRAILHFASQNANQATAIAKGPALSALELDALSGLPPETLASIVNFALPRAVAIAHTAVTAESCAPANGYIDPGETITFALALRAAGTAGSTNLVATLLPTGGVTAPSGPATYGVLSPGGPPVTNSFTFTASGPCRGTLIATWQLQDGPLDLGTVSVQSLLGNLVFVTNSFAGGALSVPSIGNATPYPSSNVVAGLSAGVAKVLVRLDGLAHAAPADLEVLLVSPAGQRVILLSDAGGATPASEVSLTFDDDAPGFVPAAGPLVTGAYKPTNVSDGSGDPFPAPAPAGPYATNLSAFTSASPNGAWRLFVTDDLSGNTGALSGWTLTIVTVQTNCCVDAGLADLALGILDTPDPAGYGATITYSLRATNRGPATATGVVVSNTIPPGMTFVSANSTLGSCTNLGEGVSCALGSLASNATAFIAIVLRGVEPGLMTSVARILANEGDFNPSDNTATAVTTVLAPALTVNDVSVTERNSDTTNVVFLVRLNPASSNLVSVSFTTADGLASAGIDYLATNGTLSFLPGQTTQTVSVTVLGDTLIESNETFTLNLFAPVGATNSDPVGVATIVNDDPLPYMFISDVTVQEGQAGLTAAAFNVQLSALSEQTVQATYTTVNGSAFSPADFVGTNGTVVFLPRQTNALIVVQVRGDTTNEANETFSLNLSSLINALAGDLQAVGTILNDDPASVAFLAAGLVTETCAPTNRAVDPGETVTMNFDLRNSGTGIGVTNLVATLLPTPGVTPLSGPQSYGTLPVGSATVSRSFVFTADGACGAQVPLVLALQTAAGSLGPVTNLLRLGRTAGSALQNFDGVTPPALPAGWTGSWITSSAQRDTLPNSVYTPDPGSSADLPLTSPLIPIDASGLLLTFRHAFSTESCCDGGRLEISIAGGAFTEWLTAGGSFLSNGYTGVIFGGAAWVGTSPAYPAFITTVAAFPAAATGQNVQLRWRFTADGSVSGLGWYLDTLALSGAYACCDPDGIARLRQVTYSNGFVELRWDSLPGARYQLQYKTNLDAPTWTTAPGIITATSDTTRTTNQVDAVLRRFYRLQVVP